MPSKKSFKEENPALDFISNQNKPKLSDAPTMPNDPIDKIIESVTEPNVKQEENRSKRFSLAVQPSLYDDLSVAATIYRTNINDLCNSILSEYIGGKIDQINKFRELSNQFFK